MDNTNPVEVESYLNFEDELRVVVKSSVRGSDYPKYVLTRQQAEQLRDELTRALDLRDDHLCHCAICIPRRDG